MLTGVPRLRLLVADDQAVVRLGFAAMVDAQPDMVVVGSAADGRDLLQLAGQTQSDVVLMDVRMPVMSGIEATRALQRLPAPPRVLMLTTFDLDEYVYDALRAGASGFLLKDAAPAQILEAIRVVADGQALLAPTVTRRLIERCAAIPQLRPAPQLSTLTPREREVLDLLALGLSNGEIAARLHLVEQTVKTHVSAVLLKLRIRDRVQAVVLAYESGLVTPGAGARTPPTAGPPPGRSLSP